MTEECARERYWIVLSTDGRHVTLGRHSDPTEEEILAVEHSLEAKGLAGWLVVMEGNYYSSRGQLGLMMVRPLAAPAWAFEHAVAAFQATRARALQPA